MTHEELAETLTDARLYLNTGDPDAVRAALDMLDEVAAELTKDDRLANDALVVVDQCLGLLVEEGDHGLTERTLDIFFAIAGRLDPEIAAIDPTRLAIYRRSLLLCKCAAIPARRAARHAHLQTLFLATRWVDGWVAECGCANGLSFLQLCFQQADQMPLWAGEGFSVFDSFEGLSEPKPEDLDVTDMEPQNARRVLSMTRAGGMAFGYTSVTTRIHALFPRVEVHRGWLPQTLANVAEHRYRFVHVDVDLYEPTKGCFEYFYPRLVPGGIIVTDDYNWPGGRRAVNEFCEASGLTPQLTATNQAYLLKP